MKIIHRTPTSSKDPIRRDLELLGFRFTKDLEAFLIDEGNAYWPQVAKLFEHYRSFQLVYAEFTDREVQTANYVALHGVGAHGYPQPEDDFGYKKTTYDDSNYCEQCHCGLVQKAPFALRCEPKWGKRSGFLQLNWVEDEYFVHPDIWAAVLKPLGIHCREVHSRKGATLETVVQLEIPEVDIAHRMEEQQSKRCEACGVVKYRITPGFFPPLDGKCDLPIFKTRDYRGGGAACKPVIASKEFCAVVRANNLRGLGYSPLARPTTDITPNF
jgi:hypothetical protein